MTTGNSGPAKPALHAAQINIGHAGANAHESIHHWVDCGVKQTLWLDRVFSRRAGSERSRRERRGEYRELMGVAPPGIVKE